MTRLRLLYKNNAKKLGKYESILDLKIVSGKYRPIKTYRILLAKFSTYFYNYFKEHPNDKEMSVPVNPNNSLSIIISLLVNGEATISRKKLPSLAYTAYYYKFESPFFIFKDQILLDLTETSVLFYSSEFNKLKFDYFAEYIANQFSGEICKYFKGTSSMFTINDIFRSSSCHVFSLLLRNEKVKNELSTERKIQIIDKYVKFRDVELTNKEKAHLTSAINWNEPNIYEHFIKNDCDWVADDAAYNMAKSVLVIRKKIIDNFVKSMSAASGDISNLSLLTWLSAIQNTEVVDGTPTVDALEFVTTLGYHDTSFEILRLLNAYISTSPILNDIFSEKAPFYPNSDYFLSHLPVGEQLPFYEIGFNESKLIVYNLHLSCHVAQPYGGYKPLPKSLILRLYAKGNSAPVYEQKLKYSKYQPSMTYKNYVINCSVPVNRIVLTIKKNSYSGSNILRICRLAVTCQFVP